MIFLPRRDEERERDLISTFDTYQEYCTTKQTLIVSIRNKYERCNGILEETIDDINANKKMDGIFDFERKGLETHVGKTTGANEYAFYDPDSPEAHRCHNVERDLGISAKYDTAVDLSSFTMTDDDYNKIYVVFKCKTE